VAVTAPDGTAWRYLYDPLGRRVAKQHVSASGEVLKETRFSWDGAVLAEQSEGLDADGRELVTTWDYHPGTFTPLAQATRTSLRDAPQEVIDEQFCSIITDLTGTPTELITADGTLAGYQQRTLWGNTLWHPSGQTTPLRFPGQYADPETGLHYNNQRYYDPITGAYLTPDPLGLSPAPNPHTYVPNPHVLTDPLGLAADDAYGAGSPLNSDQLDQAYNYANSPAKLEHVIDPAKHGLSDLVQAAGGRSEAMREIVNSLSNGTGLPAQGPFEVIRVINGQTITIRGAMVNGIPKIGTAFDPAAFPGTG
jgi:RHS repeat-associated protein